MSWDSIKNTRLALHPPRLSHHLPGQTSETQPGKLWSEAWQAHCSTWVLCSSKVNRNRHPHKHLEKSTVLRWMAETSLLEGLCHLLQHPFNLCHTSIQFWASSETAVLLKELFGLEVEQLLRFPTCLQCHSTRTKPLPFKYTILTFVADDASPSRWTNTATALTVTSASIHTVFTAQATVVAKSVIKANWKEKMQKTRWAPGQNISMGSYLSLQVHKYKRNTYNTDDLKKTLFRLLPFMLIALQISLSHSRRWSRMDIPKFLTLNCKVWTKGNLGLHLQFTPLNAVIPLQKGLKTTF